MHIKKGNSVIIIAGKDKGKRGKVIRSFPKKSKVLIEGLNITKKHQRPKRKGEKGQVLSVPMPLDVSNIKKV